MHTGSGQKDLRMPMLALVTSPFGSCLQGGGLCRLWFYKELRDKAPQFHGPVEEPNFIS